MTTLATRRVIARRIRPLPAAGRHHLGPVDPALRLELIARHFARAYVEVRDGMRPYRSLSPYVCPAVLDAMAAMVRAHRDTPAHPQPLTVLRVVVTPTVRGWESCVVLRHGQRVMSVAMRLERRNGRLVVRDLGAPEERSLHRSAPAAPEA